MNKLSKLKSFDDFKNSITLKHEIKSESVREHKAVITTQREKLLKPVNEAAFKLGKDYKVKVTVDVPVSLIQSYIQKVTEETGKNALDNFSENELAEQMVQYIVKQNLHIDSIPSALSVGDQPAQNISTEQQVDAAKLGAAFGDEQELNFEDEMDLDLDLDLEIEEETSDEIESEDIEITDGDLSLDGEESDEEAINLDSDDVAEFGDEKEEGEELELEDSEETLGEEREVENESSDSEEEKIETETESEEEEETVLDANTEAKTISQMKTELASSGLDPRFIEDDLEIVDLWNEIFMPEYPISGKSLSGELITPSVY
jgi:hypothetical protein